jgi:predicted Rossmann-fold nucleotide-binding protein
MGTDYWDEILPFIHKMAKAGMIAPSDLELVHASNSVDEAIAHIRTPRNRAVWAARRSPSPAL